MVARQIILLLVCVSVTWATQIEVKALNFYSDENKGESILSGNVEVIRGDDILNSEKLIIYHLTVTISLNAHSLTNSIISVSTLESIKGWHIGIISLVFLAPIIAAIIAV